MFSFLYKRLFQIVEDKRDFDTPFLFLSMLPHKSQQHFCRRCCFRQPSAKKQEKNEEGSWPPFQNSNDGLFVHHFTEALFQISFWTTVIDESIQLKTPSFPPKLLDLYQKRQSHYYVNVVLSMSICLIYSSNENNNIIFLVMIEQQAEVCLQHPFIKCQQRGCVCRFRKISLR